MDPPEGDGLYGSWRPFAIRRGSTENPYHLRCPRYQESLTDPLAELAAFSCIGRLQNLDDLLEYYPDEGALVLMIEYEQTLSRQWKNFFDAIRRLCQRAGSQSRLRPVLAVIIGSREYPPITRDVGTRLFALWNTVRWEELRLYANDMLPRGENALTRAWRVATYAGAANGDPDILVRSLPEIS